MSVKLRETFSVAWAAGRAALVEVAAVVVAEVEVDSEPVAASDRPGMAEFGVIVQV